MEYIDEIMKISNGDIKQINFTHGSKASLRMHPTSRFTAAVQDINDGLVDLSVGPFWITAQRLKLSSFSVPIINDKTYLVIPKPNADNLGHQVQKVWRPFKYGLWVIVFVVIVVTSLLTVWFQDKPRPTLQDIHSRSNIRGTNLSSGGTPKRRRKRVYARLALDAFLEHGLFFCSAGVEQDKSSSLPIKVLLFGFGFFTLISVSAYVANLAAFLTLSGTNVQTMNDAVKLGVPICAHPAVRAELEGEWEGANFYFHQNGNEFPGLLNDYDAGKCELLAVGYEDTSMDNQFLQGLCNRKLVYTKSVLAQIPVAFPVRPKIASGLSYWEMEARKQGFTLKVAKEKNSNFKGCNVHLSEETAGGEEEQISEWNMIFPIIFFICSAAIAVILHLIHLYNIKNGKKSLVGRGSTLDQSLFRQGPALETILEECDGNEQNDGQDQGLRISKSGSSTLELANKGSEDSKVTFYCNNKTDSLVKEPKRRDSPNTIVTKMQHFTLSEVETENNMSNSCTEASS